MKFLKITLFSITILLNVQIHAQDLTKHQWKDRVLLIVTDNPNSKEFQKQVKTLKHQETELKNRKLIIYQITPSEYKMGFSEEKKWIKNDKLYNNTKTIDNSFEVILIGLDGGEKLRQNELLSADKLFDVIDGMPMRRSEIENKN